MPSVPTARALSIISLSLMLLILLAIHPTISVRAASSPTLSIAPSSQPLASPGSTVTFSVNVSNIRSDFPVAGWSIYVVTNASILDPVSLTLGSFVAGVTELTRCINGTCTIGAPTGDDGPGVVHTEATTGGTGNSGNGTLFTISYSAVAGPYTFVSFFSPNAETILLDLSGVPISFTPFDGDYGNVPALPVARFNYYPPQPFAGVRVTFNGTTSSAPSGHKIVNYLWTFAATTTTYAVGNISITSKVFDAGNWTVTLVVKDDRGISSRSVTLPINVASKPSLDLSILSHEGGGFSASPFDNILPGTPVTIKVLVKNIGTITVTGFNVSVSVAGRVLKAPPNQVVLESRGQASTTFTWNTTDAPPDTYVLHAHVDPLPNENDTANNDAFTTVRLIYPFQGAPLPFSFLQFLGLGFVALLVLGVSVALIGRIQNRRLLAQRDVL